MRAEGPRLPGWLAFSGGDPGHPRIFHANAWIPVAWIAESAATGFTSWAKLVAAVRAACRHERLELGGWVSTDSRIPQPSGQVSATKGPQRELHRTTGDQGGLCPSGPWTETGLLPAGPAEAPRRQG